VGAIPRFVLNEVFIGIPQLKLIDSAKRFFCPLRHPLSRAQIPLHNILALRGLQEKLRTYALALKVSAKI
jgi:hypothetical protein